MLHNSIAAIVLAAGQGKRLKSKKNNKVTLSLGGKPMILYTINLLNTLHVHPIVVVVGFAKRSVMEILKYHAIIFAEQHKRLGPGHAALAGLKKLPQDILMVLILNGDDSAFLPKETIQRLLHIHKSSRASLTFLTIHMDNPQGLGRIVREGEKLIGIIEEKDATGKQRQIKEVNAGCYIANASFLKKYLPKIKKSPVTGEYYLTDLVALGVKHNERVAAMYEAKFQWRGVNTKEELEEAERLFAQKN